MYNYLYMLGLLLAMVTSFTACSDETEVSGGGIARSVTVSLQIGAGGRGTDESGEWRRECRDR